MPPHTHTHTHTHRVNVDLLRCLLRYDACALQCYCSVLFVGALSRREEVEGVCGELWPSNTAACVATETLLLW